MTCHRYTLGAFIGGWRAICLDCSWSEAATDAEDNFEAARAVGERHIAEPSFLGVPWKGDPDLSPDVFWVLDGDGQPVGVGLFSAEDSA